MRHDRVVTLHRDDLLPYQQDLYDRDGNLETQVSYNKYTQFGASKYPSIVTIKRPLEGIQIEMTVERVIENPTLTDEQFQIKMPEGIKTQTLE